MKEIYLETDNLDPLLQDNFRSTLQQATAASIVDKTEWVQGLLQQINFTNEFQISLFHEGFASGNSPIPPTDRVSVLFIKLHEATIFNDSSGDIYFHGFISSWDTTTEPSIFLLKGFNRDDISHLVESGLIPSFSLINM